MTPHKNSSDDPRWKIATAAVSGVFAGAARAVIAWLLARLLRQE
ncbi:hypothetical protein H181DRAFT_01855 [Streptomyces sp. WMMB 714]|jgi:hypothetical protein|nr:hypothetical protein [Streptomyces sp. WMMB 714]SCK24461.1 hypothetical protein H181DRAFT_01855 [Streptomyces sp. WMMB 714]